MERMLSVWQNPTAHTFKYLINNEYKIEIVFDGCDFERVNYDFSCPYTREQWKILAWIDSEIDRLEEFVINKGEK